MSSVKAADSGTYLLPDGVDGIRAREQRAFSQRAFYGAAAGTAIPDRC
jgi:hypothetical protein